MLFSTPEQHARFRLRADQYVETGLLNCDPAMVDLVRAFQYVDGLETMYSCEGHYGDPHYGDSSYIMFSATAQGAEFLFQVLKTATEIMLFSELGMRAYDLSIKIVHRLEPTAESPYRGCDYPAWMLTFDYLPAHEGEVIDEVLFEEIKSHLFSVLKEAVNEVKAKV